MAASKAEDLAFKVQRGFILPKLEEQLKVGLTTIIEEVMECSVKGTLEGQDKPGIKEIKDLVMQNIDLFITDTVLPPIDEKFNPPPAEPEAAAEEPEPAVEEAKSGE